MKKSIILVAVVLAFAACKGPRSGPLVKESFDKGGPMQSQVQNPAVDGKAHMGQVSSEKINVVVEPCDGCITIAKLLETKQSVSGKVVKIKGSVTKFNPQIMGKNWVHIQDGSEFQGAFDLTITTDVDVIVGQVVIFQGIISLNKDFGYGYSYNVLMEQGKIVQ